MRVLLFGEGNTDVTRGTQRTQGAVCILLKKLIEGARPKAREIHVEGARLPRLQQGSGFARKIKLAISQARRFDAIAIVVDRDGPRNSKRLSLLEQGRADAIAASHQLASRTAIGVAIEMLEAWLLADTAALAKVARVGGAARDPETILDPKTELAAILESSDLDSAAAFDSIAQAASVEVIRKRCPAFDAFAKEVRHFVAGADQ